MCLKNSQQVACFDNAQVKWGFRAFCCALRHCDEKQRSNPEL